MNLFLIIASALNALIAVMHIGCIYFGAPWYRFLGAGEHMATLAEQGSIEPAIITSIIVLVLSVWSLYLFSTAGVIRKLPRLRTVLIVITSVFFMRGVAGFF